jgi:SAM-dependent methyltransferase
MDGCKWPAAPPAGESPDVPCAEAAPLVSWSALYQQRRQAAQRFGPLFALPVVRRARDVLLRTVRDGDELLEVGAGDRRMQQRLAASGRRVAYWSMDIDPATPHDYRSLAEIDRRFDCICALEVIEHLPLGELLPWLRRLHDLLRAGGRLVLSTPNTYCPAAYLRDCTHRTPLCYDELAALVSLAGFEVRHICRLYNESWPARLVRRRLCGWLFRLLRLDYAPQIALVAVRDPEAATQP